MISQHTYRYEKTGKGGKIVITNHSKKKNSLKNVSERGHICMFNLAQQSGRNGSTAIFTAVGKGTQSSVMDLTFLTKISQILDRECESLVFI